MAREGSALVSGFRPDPITVVEREADRIVVSLYGEHDISTLAELSEAMAQGIALDDAEVVVDLSGVEFMGAGTVTVIVRARDFLRALAWADGAFAVKVRQAIARRVRAGRTHRRTGAAPRRRTPAPLPGERPDQRCVTKPEVTDVGSASGKPSSSATGTSSIGSGVSVSALSSERDGLKAAGSQSRTLATRGGHDPDVSLRGCDEAGP